MLSRRLEVDVVCGHCRGVGVRLTFWRMEREDEASRKRVFLRPSYADITAKARGNLFDTVSRPEPVPDCGS